MRTVSQWRATLVLAKYNLLVSLRSIAYDELHMWEMPGVLGGLAIWTAGIGVWAVKAFKWE
jgi:hypothetical protein